jgi:hypothetical protein
MVFGEGNAEQRNGATIGNAAEPVEDEKDIPPRQNILCQI